MVGYELIQSMSNPLAPALFQAGLSPVFRGGGSDGKESACSAGDPGLIPGLGRYPGEGNGNPLQYCCLEKSMDKGAHRVAKSQT